MSLYNHDEIWWSDGDGPEERVDDGDGDLPLSEDYPTHAVPLLAEPADSRLQAWEGMAVRAFGSRTVDSRPNEIHRHHLN
jgi:hypothetical protein